MAGLPTGGIDGGALSTPRPGGGVNVGNSAGGRNGNGSGGVYTACGTGNGSGDGAANPHTTHVTACQMRIAASTATATLWRRRTIIDTSKGWHR